jgi:hypothetical protein
MVQTHQRKIDEAKDLCASLYEGYEPLDKAMDGFLEEETASVTDEDPC